MFMQPEETHLFDEEKATLLRLLKKIGNRKTGKEILEAFGPIFPMVPVEVAVIRHIEGTPQPLLTRGFLCL